MQQRRFFQHIIHNVNARNRWNMQNTTLSSFSRAGFLDLRRKILDHLRTIEAPMAALFQFIRKGTSRRRIDDPIYAGRLEYTQALRRFVYNPAVLNEVLWDPTLKEQFCRVFGYRGNLDFTIYPSAWIRDLALADYHIGKNVYLADGIVLGTNQVSPDQSKLHVGPISIGDAADLRSGLQGGTEHDDRPQLQDRRWVQYRLDVDPRRRRDRLRGFEHRSLRDGREQRRARRAHDHREQEPRSRRAQDSPRAPPSPARASYARTAQSSPFMATSERPQMRGTIRNTARQ